MCRYHIEDHAHWLANKGLEFTSSRGRRGAKRLSVHRLIESVAWSTQLGRKFNISIRAEIKQRARTLLRKKLKEKTNTKPN